MDPRIEEHAHILVDWSTDIRSGDDVFIAAVPDAHELVVTIHRAGNPGGQSDHPLHVRRGVTGTPSGPRGRLYAAQAYAGPLRGLRRGPARAFGPNLAALNDVSSERLSKRWCVTHAQTADLSLAAYRDFVYGAILRDWAAVKKRQEELRRRLEAASTVRVVAWDETDIQMRVEGTHAINSAGRHNMPSGEVFTAPVLDNVEGTVLFDKPLIH